MPITNKILDRQKKVLQKEEMDHKFNMCLKLVSQATELTRTIEALESGDL